MPLPSLLSFKSWNLWVLVATSSKSLLEHDGLVHLTVLPPLPKSTRELCLLWCHWPRDLDVISDLSVLAFESLSFKYPAADLPGYRNLTPTLIPVHPR